MLLPHGFVVQEVLDDFGGLLVLCGDDLEQALMRMPAITRIDPLRRVTKFETDTTPQAGELRALLKLSLPEAATTTTPLATALFEATAQL